MPNSGQNLRFSVQCDLEIWWMTLKNNRAPLLCRFKLCASFHSHQWIKTKVTVRKRSIRAKISDLLSRVTSKFNGWPWKTIGHLFYVASNFMHHFIAIAEFKLKLQSRNDQLGSKLVIFCSVWPWNLMDDLEKQEGTSSMLLQALCIISSSYVNSNWSYSPETAKLGYDLCDLDLILWPWPFAWTSLLSLVITPENFVMIWWQEHSEKGVTDRQTGRQTDRQTHRRTDRQKEVFLELLGFS